MRGGAGRGRAPERRGRAGGGGSVGTRCERSSGRGRARTSARAAPVAHGGCRPRSRRPGLDAPPRLRPPSRQAWRSASGRGSLHVCPRPPQRHPDLPCPLSCADLEIRIRADAAAQTIVIEDSGVGLTREEILDTLGTIAKSGAPALRLCAGGWVGLPWAARRARRPWTRAAPPPSRVGAGACAARHARVVASGPMDSFRAGQPQAPPSLWRR